MDLLNVRWFLLHLCQPYTLRISVKSLVLAKIQGQTDAAEKDAESIIRRRLGIFQGKGFNCTQFFDFLFSEDLNPALDSKVFML
ncbi:hypothetical protein SUGI_0337190 [Cryptomeria japonica]|nr:hypothetical protein SUGI_0337190 [Cryptomeria japonica]